jgi:hypothetical protein
MNTPSNRIGWIVSPVFFRDRTGFALALALAMMCAPFDIASAAEVSGVRVDPRARVAGVELALNGAGLRRLFLANVYVIGLYMPERTNSADTAIEATGPKRIALTFLRDVTAQALVDALYEGIRDSSTETEFTRLKTAAEALSAVMLPLRTAKAGDVVALDYLPGAGSQVVMNGRAVGQPIPGHDLYRALLRIWLGEPPVDNNLKRLLLGRN